MATKYTANYRLCQWEPTDKVLRTDFNEDNAKTDAALKAHDSRFQQLQTALSKCYTSDVPQLVWGTYKGDGAAARVIPLGFAPKAVIVIHRGLRWCEYASGYAHYYSGIALPGDPAQWTATTPVMLASTGFQVGYSTPSGGNWIVTNDALYSYYYIAFR